MNCDGCGKSLEGDRWAKCMLCSDCHFKKHGGELPEQIRKLVGDAALAIDDHDQHIHGGLNSYEECRVCLDMAWTTFCQLRAMLAMGDTWTYFQRISTGRVGSETPKKQFPYSCPRCGGSSNSCGPAYERKGAPPDAPMGQYNERYDKLIYTQGSCGRHTWRTSPEGATIVMEYAPEPPTPPEPRTLFDEWADLNEVMAPSRSRFDVLRERMPLCKTKKEVKDLLVQEQFDTRYPLIPEKFPDV